MKIYCKNCKYNNSAFFIEFSTCTPIKYTSPIENDYYSTNHKTGKGKQIFWMYRLNKNNDCPHYKRKWYKFWIKEEK